MLFSRRTMYLWFALVTACAHARELPPADERQLLPFVEDGQTTKEQILLQLGIPSAQFDGERILTYRLARTEDGKVRPVAREFNVFDFEDPRLSQWKIAGAMNLVLVFDERGVLARHRLLQVK